MERKIFLSLLSALLFVSVHIAQAQKPKRVSRIGILRVGSPPDVFIDAFRQGLHEIGYVEGQNLLIEYRWLKREDQFAESAEGFGSVQSRRSYRNLHRGSNSCATSDAIGTDYRSGNGRSCRQRVGR